MGMNDGGIKRGDREETGDLEAQENEPVNQTGTGKITGQPSALGGGPSKTGPTKLDTEKNSTLSNP